jgi:hypothetical protein
VDSGEDEWQRLHDVRLNGTVLEYVGRGKSLVDVGLAQARTPIGTRNHYFEIEVSASKYLKPRFFFGFFTLISIPVNVNGSSIAGLGLLGGNHLTSSNNCFGIGALTKHG